MSVARILSRAELGLSAPTVQVEVHLASGLPSFTIVGLPAPVVRESRERVRAALVNSGYDFPQRRITVNLAPVELAKHGGRFDLPIALGLLVASGQLALRGGTAIECYGELGLDGELRAVAGLFLATLHAGHDGHAMLVPCANVPEVGLAAPVAAYAAATLREAAQLLAGLGRRGCTATPIAPTTPNSACSQLPGRPRPAGGLSDVIGQSQAKRALQIAAAGSHGLLLIGPPGSGKSMLAARLPRLLPALSRAEALEVACIRAAAGLTPEPAHFSERPFRAPHHTSSAQAMVGGGPLLRPGEISLAHHGVLFLDELPEFDRRVLEALREPLENGRIGLARATRRLELPARFQLIAAMNPCPCGYLGDSRIDCRCPRAYIERYRQRLSGPLLDRIDMRVHVERLADSELLQAVGASSTGGAGAEGPGCEGSGECPCTDPCEGPAAAVAPAAPLTSGAPEAMSDAVLCRSVQLARQWRITRSGAPSAHLGAVELRGCCRLSSDATRLLHRSCQRWALSGRGVQRLLALSRTIADLAASEPIEAAHLAEALQLRRPFELQ
ncbi:MAG TPA: YifB family Mg chelatase-like AAA ATPase [Steroidobacteraceae bacterium]|nr:YifB family Mg chelatase-like AAA ATPase [Steroidobacteraceae bacterium]